MSLQNPGGFRIDPVDETRWAKALLEETGLDYRIVGFVDLSRPDAADVLAAHLHIAGSRFVGVRMILNYSASDPCLTWPQVAHGEYLRGAIAGFNDGLRLLEKTGLSFDLHANWFQLREAASLLSRYPSLRVIVNHLGCPKLSGTDAIADKMIIREWTEGIMALAANPNVHLKLSCLEYVRKGWVDAGTDAYNVVHDLVHTAIHAFGTDRIMFTSNFPVDKYLSGRTLLDQYAGYGALVSAFSEADQRKMFRENALRVYKFYAGTEHQL